MELLELQSVNEFRDATGGFPDIPKYASGSRRIDHLLRSIDVGLDVGVLDGRRHHEINRPREESFELVLQSEVHLQCGNSGFWFELDEEVDVA